MADVSRICEVHSLHGDTEPLPRVSHVLNITGTDDGIRLGVEVKLRPPGGRLQQGVVVALVDEASQWVQQDLQQDNCSSKSEHKEIPEQHVRGCQHSGQGTKGSSQIPSARGTIKNSACHFEVLKGLLSVKRLNDVTVEHGTTVAKDVEKHRPVLNAVVKEQLQESLGWRVEGFEAKALSEEYRPPRSCVADDSAPLNRKRTHTYLVRAVNHMEQASCCTTN